MTKLPTPFLAHRAAPGDLPRRSFLGLSLLAAGTIFFGCADEGSAADTAGGSGGAGAAGKGGAGAAGQGGAGAAGGPAEGGQLGPFDIWEKLRTAVRSSPDHLGATADRLVAGKDPNALFEFVRDQIVAYPPSDYGGAVTGVRWGVRGTLRGGAGTPREKADLLAFLYQRAGFEAEVVVGAASDTDPARSPAERAYLRPSGRSFDPSLEPSTLAEWTKAMAAAGVSGQVAPIDPHNTAGEALAASLAALLPGDLAAQMGPYEATLETAAITDLPLVAVTVEGKKRYANPLFAEATFGDSLTDDTPVPAPAASPAPAVVVELLVSTTAAPTTQVVVVRGEYQADQLAGRQLLAQFVPTADAATLARLTIADLHAFKPLLTLRGPDVEPGADPSFVVIGSQVTLYGDIVETAEDGTVTLNGQPLFAPSLIDPAAASQVASLGVQVRGGAFPTIQLQVTALDAAGKAVRGLPASAFRVLEGQDPMSFIESGAPSEGVRVFLDFDLDETLGTGEDPLEFARQLTSAVIAAYPGAVIVTGTPGAYVEHTDPDSVAAAVMGADSDDTWSDLAIAAGARPTLTVIVSDFEGLTDPRDPAAPKGSYRATVAVGPPVAAISTDGSINPALVRLVGLTSGAISVGGGIKDGVQMVLDLLAELRTGGGSYALTYRAPVVGPTKRAVSVAIGAQSAEGDYLVPAAGDLVEQGALAGVYLRVTQGDSSVTRVLGGYRHSDPPAFGVPVAPSVIDEVKNALFGASMLSFEAAAPSLSTAIDELLSIKLAIRPLWEALSGMDDEAIQAALPTLRTYVPSELTTLQCAPARATKQSCTYEEGLRIVHYSHQPRFGVGHERRVDILPLSGWGTISADAVTSFQGTLARTARVAIVESHTFPTSTLSALAGRQLSLLPLGLVDPAMLPYAPEARLAASEVLDRYENWYRLLPTGPEFVGFWAISAQSGTLLGVLPDGSGGAVQSEECKSLSDLGNAFTALGLVAGLAGVGGLSLYFLLGKEAASVALLSAAILDNQEVGQGLGDPNAPLKGLASAAACDAAQLAFVTGASATGTAAGDAVEGADNANSVANLLGGGLSCPNALAGVGCQ